MSVEELDVVTTRIRRLGFTPENKDALIPPWSRGTIVHLDGDWCQVEFVDHETGAPWAFGEYTTTELEG